MSTGKIPCLNLNGKTGKFKLLSHLFQSRNVQSAQPNSFGIVTVAAAMDCNNNFAFFCSINSLRLVILVRCDVQIAVRPCPKTLETVK